MSFASDIDECSVDSSPCDENANCNNTDGSYSCTCTQGFTGDGATCNGKFVKNTCQYKSVKHVLELLQRKHARVHHGDKFMVTLLF